MTVPARRDTGFTYLGVLFIVAFMGILLALAGESWHTASQREKERELLYVGSAFRNAIGLYYNRTPGNVKKFPRNLEDLLKDPRQLTTQRYLRRIYVDPMTGTTEWGIVKSADGGIAGVFSLAESEPIKIASFADEDAGFEDAKSYADWKFVFRPRAPTVGVGPPGVPPTQAPGIPGQPLPGVPGQPVAGTPQAAPLPAPVPQGPPTVFNSPVD